jgi:murein DD-endopeptidase MepM/ murein hydrolase activator NlpD
MRLSILFILSCATIICACAQSTGALPQQIGKTPFRQKQQTTTVPTKRTDDTHNSAPWTTAPEPQHTAIPSSTPLPVTMYVFPVPNAPVSYGAEHHDYPATDIFCDSGSAFVAVTDGIVDAIVPEDLWDPATDVPADRSGLAIAIIGSDGVRYYGSHLATIADGLHVGQTVHAGQVLGSTGKSGNARFTPPHLHFGISRPSTPTDWEARRGQISPYPYLKSWEIGEDLIPSFE